MISHLLGRTAARRNTMQNTIKVISEQVQATLLEIGQLDQARRAPDMDVHALEQVLDRLYQQLACMDQHVARLNELLFYHQGIVHRRMGHYHLAATAQTLAVDCAKKAGSPERAAICQFVVAVECVNEELCHDSLALSELEGLRTEAGHVRETLADATDPMLVQWRDANIPAHVLVAHIWTCKDYLERPQDERQIMSLTGDLADQFKHWMGIAAASRAFHGRHFGDVDGIIDAVIAENRHVDTTATALLMKARATLADEVARRTLQQIIDLPAEGAHQVRAVARRELQALS